MVHCGLRGTAILAVIFSWFHECFGISCYFCDYTASSDYCVKDTGVSRVCPSGVDSCQIGIGTRNISGGKHGPVMGRNCNDMQNPAEDKKLWAKLTAGATMICKMQTHSASLLGLDRRCLCKADKCNDQIWNDVVVQPVLPESFGDGDTPQIQTLGTNSAEEILAATAPSKKKDGMSTTTLIAIAAGAVAGLLLLCLLFYCICRRKKRRAADEDERASGVSTYTGASRSGYTASEYDVEEDPSTGLRMFKTELKT